MRSIIKKIGVLFGALAAMASTGCNKSQQGNTPTNEQNSEAQLPSADGEPVAIYGMPEAFGQPVADEPLPSDEESGIMALYGMPDDLDQEPVAPAPDDAERPAPIYGMQPVDK